METIQTNFNEITIFGSKTNPNINNKVSSLAATDQSVAKDLITKEN